MGRVACGTLHLAVFIQRKYFRNLHVGGWRHIGFVTGFIVHPYPGIFYAAVMAGKTHFRRRHNLFPMILHQVRAFAVNKKGVYPAIMTDGTPFS